MAFFQESFNLKIGNKGRKDKRLSKNNKSDFIQIVHLATVSRECKYNILGNI